VGGGWVGREVDRIWDSGKKRGREVYGRRKKKRGKKKWREPRLEGAGGGKFVPPIPLLAIPYSLPIQSELAEMSNPGIKVSRNGQFAVKW